MKTEHFDCVCYSPEHTLRFILDEEEQEVYTDVYLNQSLGFVRRLIVAAKYILKIGRQDGTHYDCFLLRPEDGARLAQLAEKLYGSSLDTAPTLRGYKDEYGRPGNPDYEETHTYDLPNGDSLVVTYDGLGGVSSCILNLSQNEVA